MVDNHVCKEFAMPKLKHPGSRLLLGQLHLEFVQKYWVIVDALKWEIWAYPAICFEIGLHHIIPVGNETCKALWTYMTWKLDALANDFYALCTYCIPKATRIIVIQIREIVKIYPWMKLSIVSRDCTDTDLWDHGEMRGGWQVQFQK